MPPFPAEHKPVLAAGERVDKRPGAGEAQVSRRRRSLVERTIRATVGDLPGVDCRDAPCERSATVSREFEQLVRAGVVGGGEPNRMAGAGSAVDVPLDLLRGHEFAADRGSHHLRPVVAECDVKGLAVVGERA